VDVTVKDFDLVAQRLLRRYAATNPALLEPLKKYVEGCQHYCTGNLA